MNPLQQKFCPICGNKLEPGATYCKSCGSEFSKQNENSNQILKEQTKLDQKVAKLEYYKKMKANNPQYLNRLQNNSAGYRQLRSKIRIPMIILVLVIFGMDILSNFVPGFNFNFSYIIFAVIPIFIIAVCIIMYKTVKPKKQMNQLNNLSDKIEDRDQTLTQKDNFSHQKLDSNFASNQNLFKENTFSSWNKHSNNKKYCHVCGKKLEPGATYCKACWADVPNEEL